jgi:hypothetical protein
MTSPVNDLSYYIIAAFTIVGSFFTWLVRRVFTNDKQIALLEQHLTLLEEDIKEIKDDIKSLL